MIRDRKLSPDWKSSPNWTENDPEPQMIPDVDRTEEWHGVRFPGFSLIFKFIHFHQLNYGVDKHKEMIFSRRKL